MKADELIALADAHGIDFLRVAGGSNKADGIASKRRRVTIEIEPGITHETRKRHVMEAPDTAKGKGSRVARAAGYSHAELGIAAGGQDAHGRPQVSALAWAAAQHTIANDRRPETIRTLMCGLRHHANKYATQGDWEATVPSRQGRLKVDEETGVRLPSGPRRSILYLESLCMLVLDEISYRPAFTPSAGYPELGHMFAIYMGVDQRTWKKTLEERFRMLQVRYAIWFASALGGIQRKINGEDEERAA